MSVFQSKKAARKVPFKFDISPSLNLRIDEVQKALKTIDPDLTFSPESELVSSLERLVKRAENELKTLTGSGNEKTQQTATEAIIRSTATSVS